MTRNLILLIVILFSVIVSCKESDSGTEAPVITQTSFLSKGEYKLDFYLDYISPGEVGMIISSDGYMMVRGGALFIDNQKKGIGSVISISDTLVFVADNSGADLWRWDLTQKENSPRALQSGIGVRPPASVKAPRGVSRLESTHQLSENIGVLDTFVNNGKFVLRIERISLHPSVLINTVTRSGPSLSAMVTGNMKVQKPEKEELMTEIGESWYEEANSAANYITYEATEILTVSLLSEDHKDQIEEIKGLTSKSTGKTKGQQFLVLQKILVVEPGGDLRGHN